MVRRAVLFLFEKLRAIKVRLQSLKCSFVALGAIGFACAVRGLEKIVLEECFTYGFR